MRLALMELFVLLNDLGIEVNKYLNSGISFDDF